MAIPEYPITRREQYLDAIATNDTSVLPAEPITRTEQYLDAIARNGGGSGGGSGGGVLVCTMDSTTGALDHTLQEILDAPSVVLKLEYEYAGATIVFWSPLVHKAPYRDETQTLRSRLYFAQYSPSQSGDGVTYYLEGMTFKATNPTDYPVPDMGDDSGNGDDTQQA